ncbi:MAG: 16S rRNA (cytosine(967)-C(5))-methyltransferase RsmB [Pyrinomonadaceae bacterium]
MNLSPARAAAFDVLVRMERHRAFSSVLLPEFEANLAERDRALCHQLVMGVLRRKLFLDALIDKYSGGRKLDIEVRTALEIGLLQIRELDRIPDHSAVNESVSLVQRAKKTSAKGLVNALLRRAIREDAEPEFADATESVAVRSSHPKWLIERWGKEFGSERAELIAKANNIPPRPAFRLTAKGLALPADHSDREGSSISKGGFVVERMTPELRGRAERGEIYFQDEASQLVAESVRLEAGERFLDVCAAPGSKTTMIAAADPSNVLVAGDVSAARVEFLRQNCLRQGVGNVRVVRYDAEAELPFEASSFDFVLLDAPCTGTGTIRSNPEIRYFLDPADPLRMQDKQLAMLRNASKVVRPGGRLVYSTCSLEIEENEDVIAAFVADSPEFKAVRPDIPERFVTDRGFGRTFPDRDAADGFFIAKLVRG